MSQKSEKVANDKGKKEPRAPGSKAKSENLPELTHTGWREWDENMATLQEYFRDTYQDLHTIFPDPLRLTTVPAYKIFTALDPTAEQLANFTDENDPDGDRKKYFLDMFKERRQAALKQQTTQLIDREKAYHLIRSLCSAELNAILSPKAEFNEILTSDPLGLLNVIKSVVTARCDGDVDLERIHALREWYNMTMHATEDIVTYAKRAVRIYERLNTVGVPAGHLPSAPLQARKFIDGLSNTTPAYVDYKSYLRHAKDCNANDIYPKTLVAAINGATLFIRGAKATAIPAASLGLPHTALGAKGGGKPDGPPKGSADTRKVKTPKDSATLDKDSKSGGYKGKKEGKFTGECFKCGKSGHRASDCRSKTPLESGSTPHTTRLAVKDSYDDVSDKHVSFYTSFSQAHEEEENENSDFDRRISVTFTSPMTQKPTLGPGSALTSAKKCDSIQPNTSEAIFDTGATGTIITCADVLSDIATCSPTVFKGLNGSLTVTKAGHLGDIGIVHFDDRAGLPIVSASDCHRQGHQWEFRQGTVIEQDAFLLHTQRHTYKFQHRDGLYVTDLGVPPEPRYADAPIPRSAFAHPAVVRTPRVTLLYGKKLPTTVGNEANFTKREVQRSIIARQLQASLGFPPDQKLITALRAGSFLNCDVLPEDITRANAIWGTNVASLKGRTTRVRPMPPPQTPATRRSFDEQHMHCDIMFINRQGYLVSITHPLGIVLVANVENLTTPTLRQSIRRMFGTIGSRRITIVRFTSDNERGIASLVSDMNAMGVEVVTVGPGQHDHIIERMIRHLKETIRSTIFSLPYLVPDILMPHLVLSAAKKLLLFPSSTRSDRISPFEAFFGRKADARKDIGPPFGSYCQVTSRVLSNGMEPRTIGCLYLEPTMNGTGTHKFLRLDNRSVISANHFTVLPISTPVTVTVNGWASKNKVHTSQDPVFTFHDRDITGEVDDDLMSMEPVPEEPSRNCLLTPPPLLPDLTVEDEAPALVEESQIAPDPFEIRGGTEDSIVEENPFPTSLEVSGPEDPGYEIPNEIHEPYSTPPANVRTTQPVAPVEMREKSTRIRKPVDRLNLGAVGESKETQQTTGGSEWLMMTVPRALKLFPEKTVLAIESEVKSLLAKGTFTGVHIYDLTVSQKKKILRSNMNVVEKYLPTLNSAGDREVDKVKARLCVDGRAQVREDYLPDEVESPTASIASIFAIAQIAAAERRFIMVGDIGTAYLNARMPMDKPDKILHMVIAKDVADEIIKQDKSFAKYRKPDGGLLVRLEKALYGCIESANLWYQNLAGTLELHGFQANPRDLCVFNKNIRGKQFTILVYVDDLKMTCADKAAVLEMEQILLKTYGQFRTTQERILPYLGCTWDYSENGFVKVSQTGMIQDLIQAREKTHEDRGTKLTGNPNSPGAPHLFERTLDCTLLSDQQAKINHTQVAILNYLSTHGRPDITLVTGELCKRVKAPTIEDDAALRPASRC